MQVAVLGAGAWGTALAGHLATRHSTVLWARDRALIESLSQTHENERYLRGITLPAALQYDADLFQRWVTARRKTLCASLQHRSRACARSAATCVNWI